MRLMGQGFVDSFCEKNAIGRLLIAILLLKHAGLRDALLTAF